MTGQIFPCPTTNTSNTDATEIQNVPVTTTPPGGDQYALVYDAADSQLEYKPLPANRSIQVDGIGVSDDYETDTNVPSSDFTVNAKLRQRMKNKSILLNGWGISDDYAMSVNTAKQITVNGA